ncbi:MAG TPA: glycosyltransferase family 9 protein [Syntrophales bacterium]|nr:glycosyltransferase family 9 protein [Syntrophales bacterium]
MKLRVRILLFLIDMVGGFIFSVAKLFRSGYEKYDPENIRRILIFRLDGLGDLILSTAALREIRKGFPKAEITLVVGPWSAGIADCIPFYDRLIVHDHFLFSVFRGNRRTNLNEELDFIKTLRSGRYDIGIDLRGDLLSIIPLFLSAASFRFAKDTRGGGFLLTHPINGGCGHAKDEPLRLVETLGVAVADRETELTIPVKDVQYIEEYLVEKGIEDKDSVIVIAPSALYRWRAWPPEKFARVAALLAENDNCAVILLGSREDRYMLDAIRSLAGPTIINSSGELTLSQVAALIKRSSLFIGNDSGLMHIAAAVKTPMIQLFGPGEPEKFGYRSDTNIVLMKGDCPYHPCDQRRCRYQDHWCMDQISVEDVMNAVQRIISFRAS